MVPESSLLLTLCCQGWSVKILRELRKPTPIISVTDSTQLRFPLGYSFCTNEASFIGECPGSATRAMVVVERLGGAGICTLGNRSFHNGTLDVALVTSK